jgi:hypothetical protein
VSLAAVHLQVLRDAYRALKPKERLIVDRLREAVIAVAVMVSVALVAGCEQGPAQKTGKGVDRALDQDRVFGKGPVEKPEEAGQRGRRLKR